MGISHLIVLNTSGQYTSGQNACGKNTLWLVLVQSLGQLDVNARRIGEEGDLELDAGYFGKGPVQRDATGLEHLRERLEIIDFEPDVIDGAALSGLAFPLGSREAEVLAGDVDRRVDALA